MKYTNLKQYERYSGYSRSMLRIYEKIIMLEGINERRLRCRN